MALVYAELTEYFKGFLEAAVLIQMRQWTSLRIGVTEVLSVGKALAHNDAFVWGGDMVLRAMDPASSQVFPI